MITEELKELLGKQEVKELVVNKPLDNLINEARKSNALLELNQEPEKNKLELIRTVLKTGGMDSMSQVKAMEQITEILK